jgi:SPP1 family predicted phage head-tail adaptor
MAIKLQIGKLDRRIVVQRLTQGQGPYGEPTETWTEFASLWTNAYSGSGREFAAARQVNAEISMQFQIRYLDGLSTTMRILYNGQHYDIDRISEVGRRERLDIFAKARQE